MSESILVTGSSGTIGTALMKQLIEQGYDVFGNDLVSNPWSETVDKKTIIGDISDETTWSKLPDRIDTIVHLAANSRVAESIERPATSIENFRATYSALEYAKKHNVARFLLASSREVYGDSGEDPTSESEVDIRAVRNPYAASKVGSEALIYSYSDCYGIEPGVVRLSNIYGRYDVSSRVIPTFINRAMKDDDLIIYGEDKTLDFLYIDDCINGFLKAIEKFESIKRTPVNIGSGTGTTLKTLAKTVIEVLESDSEIVVTEPRKGEVDKFVSDIECASNLLGFHPNYTLKEGLKASVSWYEQNNQQISGLDN